MTKPFALLRVLQWCVFTFAAFIVIASLSPLGKLAIPGVSTFLVVAAIAFSVAVAVAHFPSFFWRMASLQRRISYAALIASFVITVTVLGQVQQAYSQTPAGAQEAAKRAATDREDAAEKAQKEASLKQDEAAQKLANLAGQKADICNTLTKQVVDGEKVLEINNVAVETSVEPNETLTCSGDAITSRGNVKIEFGLVTTPQGKSLVSIRYP